MVKLWSVALLVLGLGAVQGGRHHGLGLGYGGKSKGLGSLGLGYALGYGLAHGDHHPTGLYASPLLNHGLQHYGHHYPGYASHYGHGYGQYGTYPKYGLHLGYEIGYQGKLGFVKLKRDNQRQVQVSFGLGRPNDHHAHPAPYHG